MAAARKPEAQEIAERMHILKEEMLEQQALYDDYAKRLLAILQKEGRSREGIFTRARRSSLKITDTEKAAAWATEHHTFKIDTSKAFAIIRREFSVPEGFKVDTIEYITTAGNTQEPQE